MTYFQKYIIKKYFGSLSNIGSAKRAIVSRVNNATQKIMSAPTGSSLANLSLGVLCAAGGAIGYIKAKSLPSVSTASDCLSSSAPIRLLHGNPRHLWAWGFGGSAVHLLSPPPLQLVAGVGFGGLFAASAYLGNAGQLDTGHDVGLASSLLLTAAMGARLVRTRKAMPAGVMAAAGLVGAAYNWK
jgi:uncharacterized membrane protein (UPF0136 family)